MYKPEQIKKQEKKWDKIANELDKLQAGKNNKGVDHIKTIIAFMRAGDIEKAKAVCFNESDKFYWIPDIKEFIKDNLFDQEEKHPWSLEDSFQK